MTPATPDDPDGRMDIVKIAGLWMHNDDGTPTRAYKHICWDGCMFPNAMMTSPQTWVKILATLIRVRDAHGFRPLALGRLDDAFVVCSETCAMDLIGLPRSSCRLAVVVF